MTEHEPRTDTDTLQRVATRAFAWSFLNMATTRFATLLIGIILARILGPQEFGTFAVATVALVAVLSFNELGVSLAIVRWQGDPLKIAPTVTTISLVTSSALFGAMYLSAPVIAHAFGEPSATGVVRLMSVSVLISGAVAAPAALMQRDFLQRRRMAIDQMTTWLGAGLSLGLAALGMGAMSLAVGRVAGALLGAILFVAWSPYPFRLGFHPPTARRLAAFGLPLAGASFIVFLVGYAEQIITGGILGVTALGYYVLAFNLASWPVSMFSQPLRSVAPAAFARLQDDPERMRQTFVFVLRILCIVSMPVCLVLAAAAEEVVAFVYGDVWAPAAPVLRVLAVIALVRILFELFYDYLVVLKRSGLILAAQVVWLLLLVPGLVWAARTHGLVGVAVAQLVLVLVVVGPLYLFALTRTGLRLDSLLSTIVPSLGWALLAAGVVLLLGRTVESPFLVSCAAGLTIVATVALMGIPHRERLRELVSREPTPADRAETLADTGS